MASVTILPFDGVAPSIDPTAFVAPGSLIIGAVTLGAKIKAGIRACTRPREGR